MRKLAIALGLVAVSCSPDPPRVEMTARQFDPSTLTISAGESVVWENTTKEAHTVTAVQSSLPQGVEYFSSGGATSEAAAKDSLPQELLGPGDTFDATFEEPGTYSYYCIPHQGEGMRGTIIVEE